MSEPLKIDIWSDIACPWRYIGKRRLEAGIAAYAAGAPDRPPVEGRVPQLPALPGHAGGLRGQRCYYLVRAKRLSEAQVRSMLDRVTAIALDEGLHYDFGAVRHTNTVKAHQFLHHAKAHGLQAEAKERLLEAYFEEGRHIGRPDDLADSAAEIGLDRDDVLRSLVDDEYLNAVDADQRQAAQYSISAVPFFEIDGRFGISGAQPVEAFAQALAQVAAERDEAVVGWATARRRKTRPRCAWSATRRSPWPAPATAAS